MSNDYRPPPPNDDLFSQLIMRYQDGDLDAAELADLQQRLLDNADDRDHFVRYLWDCMLIKELLAPDTSALEASASRGATSLRNAALSFVRREPIVSTIAAALVIGAIVGLLSIIRLSTEDGKDVAGPPPEHPPANTIVALTGQLNAAWSGVVPSGPQPRFAAGRQLELKSGMAELTYDVGTRVILQGPCRYTINGVNSGSLDIGDLTARVPGGAEGFMVATPTTVLTDLGTEFTVAVAGSGETTAFVAEGEVELFVKDGPPDAGPRRLTAGSGLRVTADGQVRPLGADAAKIAAKVERVPKQLPRIVRPLVNGSFELAIDTRGSQPFPRRAGEWRGEPARIVGAENGIVPCDGQRMYRVVHADRRGAGKTAGAELRQAVDLRPYAAAIREGRLQARLTARFNRVAGDARTDTKFRAYLHAYSRPLTGTAEDHKHGTSIRWQEVETDSDPATWEGVSVAGRPGSGTQFLVVTVHVGENVYNDLKGTEFDGHYIDAVRLELTIVPPPSETGNGESRDPVKKRSAP